MNDVNGYLIDIRFLCIGIFIVSLAIVIGVWHIAYRIDEIAEIMREKDTRESE